MRFLAAPVVVASAMLAAQAFAQTGTQDITGTWLTEDGRAKIRTEHCGEGGQKLCGFVVWMKQPLDDRGNPRLDDNNPDPVKRKRPSLGLELMSGLKSDDPTHFEGQIYNAENGKMYDVTISLESPQQLKVHGCMLHFLCGSQAWERVADVAMPTTAKVATAAATKPKAISAAKQGAAPGPVSAPK